jgi:TRAP-type C4-dicarboxylate transport system permease small subunit
MSWRQWAIRIRKTVFEIFESVSGVFVIVVTAMVMLRILDRLVGAPLTGYAEYAQAMVLWIIFLGVGRAAYHDEDIRNDWVLEQLPDRAESALRGIILVVNAATVAVITASAFFVLQEFQDRVTPAAGIPFPILHGALLFGSAVLLVVYLVMIVKGLRTAVGGVA